MKIIAISDSHTMHKNYRLPEGDLLIFAGDCAGWGDKEEIKNFLSWWKKLPFKYKIFVPGNHDRFLEQIPSFINNFNFRGGYGLIDKAVEIEGIKFYGSPYSKKFLNWAFMVEPGQGAEEKWALIPNDTDILITHGPPLGILDLTFDNKHSGCKQLHKRVFEIKPKHHIFGHIHEAYGTEIIDNIGFHNVSSFIGLWKPELEIKTVPVIIEI